jgi:hypothetical protein
VVNRTFCAALALRRPFALRQGAVLHVLYPVASYQKAWWEAVCRQSARVWQGC